MTGLLVAVMMLLFVCVPFSAPWADTAPGLQNRLAQADNSQIVPPDPEQPAEAPAASSATDAAAEVLRLRDLIGEKRDEIEAGRSAALEQVEATYRANLAAIEPKDMFETELEYQQRDAREKSEVELQRARDVSGVHREHDLALSDEVEPMVQQVRGLLSQGDIIPADAIDSHLENYDPERKLFTGTLKIDSALVQTNARIYLPMKREKARVLWKNRELLKGKVRVSMNVRSLDIGIEEFWLEDPESGGRAEERIAVVEIRVPVRTHRVGERDAPSEDQMRLAEGFKASAAALAKRAEKGPQTYSNDAGIWIAEYNRLIQEARSIFTKDPHIQALQPLKPMDRKITRKQDAGMVATAVRGLEVYLTSFISNEAFRNSAAALAKRAEKGPRAHSNDAGIWTAEYNRLIQEARSIFTKDPHIQALQPLRKQDAGMVATAARGLEVYLTSFISNEAFRNSAAALAKRAEKGPQTYSNDAGIWIAEYNRLIQEARSIFTKDPHIQALQPLKPMDRKITRKQDAGMVATAARGLEVYLTSFVSNEAFRNSAAALAKRAEKGPRAHSNDAGIWIAEYNRLVQEARSIFTKDPHIQVLKTLAYAGDSYQAAEAVSTAAKRLGGVMTTAKAPLRGTAAEAVDEVTDPGYTPLDYLSYSGRFSQDAHKLAKLLGRGFSPDARDENGLTDLHYAALLNLPGLAAALLDAGADNGVKLKSDSMDYSNRMRGTLFGFGHDLAGSRRRGQTPLHYAAWFNARSVAAVLIAVGTEVNVQTNSGYMPIHYAALHNSHAVTELLIGQGANTHAKLNDGWTPLDLAIEAKASETEALLRRHEAPCNKKCS